MANTADLRDEKSALDLGNIRNSLVRMEDSIIFSLIERSQYKMNSAVYQPDCKQLDEFRLHQLKSAGSNGCLGDWMLYHTECIHAEVGRFTHPTEYPFFGPLPNSTLKTSAASCDILARVPAEAVMNSRLLDIYRNKMIPALCEAGDDGNYGSTATQDVHCIQTMATRIYYGLFVAEAKFRQHTEKATAMIKARDVDGLMAFITNKEVEDRNVQRVILKARMFAQNVTSSEDDLEPTYKIDPEYIGTVYKDFLMPLTRVVEVAYLLARLDDPQKGAKCPRLD